MNNRISTAIVLVGLLIAIVAVARSNVSYPSTAYVHEQLAAEQRALDAAHAEAWASANDLQAARLPNLAHPLVPPIPPVPPLAPEPPTNPGQWLATVALVVGLTALALSTRAQRQQ
jgi:hypothetical protein